MKDLIKLTLTLLLIAAFAAFPYISKASQFVMPNKALVERCVVNDDTYTLEQEFININHLDSEYSVDVEFSLTKPSLSKAFPWPTTPTMIVIVTVVVIGGVIVYILYKIIKKLDSVISNSPQRSTNEDNLISIE